MFGTPGVLVWSWASAPEFSASSAESSKLAIITQKQVKERTSKVQRILSRSNFQEVMAFSLILAWKGRDNTFRLPRLTMCIRISSTVLRAMLVRKTYRVRVAGSAYAANCSIAIGIV